MAIRGSSLDPVQQALDTANAMGSVSASNKEVKDSLNRLQATLIDISKKDENGAKQLKASLDRVTETLTTYFKGQQSSDLIKKTTAQMKATEALISSPSDRQASSKKEVSDFVKESDEITKNLKKSAINFSSNLEKFLNLFNGQKDLLYDTDIVKKLIEGIKNNKISNPESFFKITGIDGSKLDKSVITPLISELITAVKKGQTVEQAINNTSAKQDNTTADDTSAKQDNIMVDKQKQEQERESISEKEFKKGVLKFLKENDKNNKKNEKENEKRHKNVKELLEEGNMLNKINIIAQIPQLLNNLGTIALWGAYILGAYSAIIDICNIVESFWKIKHEGDEHADRILADTTDSRMKFREDSFLFKRNPKLASATTKKGEDLKKTAKDGDAQSPITFPNMQDRIDEARAQGNEPLAKELEKQYDEYVLAYKKILYDRYRELLQKLKAQALKAMLPTAREQGNNELLDYFSEIYRKDHKAAIAWNALWNKGGDPFVGGITASETYSSAVKLQLTTILKHLETKYGKTMQTLTKVPLIASFHVEMVSYAVSVINSFITFVYQNYTVTNNSGWGHYTTARMTDYSQELNQGYGKQAISGGGFDSGGEAVLGKDTVEFLKGVMDRHYKPRTFGRDEKLPVHISTEAIGENGEFWRLMYGLFGGDYFTIEGDKVPYASDNTTNILNGEHEARQEIEYLAKHGAHMPPHMRQQMLSRLLTPEQYKLFGEIQKNKNIDPQMASVILRGLYSKNRPPHRVIRQQLSDAYVDAYPNASELSKALLRERVRHANDPNYPLPPGTEFLGMFDKEEQKRIANSISTQSDKNAAKVIELLKSIDTHTAKQPTVSGTPVQQPTSAPPTSRQ